MTPRSEGVRARWPRSRIEVSTTTIAANVAQLAAIASPARLCAVVKANGYGHGLVIAALAAIEGGADWIAVARIEEAEGVRAEGIDVPILILSEPEIGSWGRVLAGGFDTIVYSAEAIEAASQATAGSAPTLGLHLKVDTGMHRVGCAPAEAPELADRIDAAVGVRLAGLCTHFADADDLSSDYSTLQLQRFRDADDAVAAAGHGGYLRHAANSAATLRIEDSRLDLVRCGIACYGIAPSSELDVAMPRLVGALRLMSEVAFVKRLAAGESVSYGRRYRTSRDTTIVTVPVGYGDGVPRSLAANGGEALIAGRRFPVVGTVTMDQMMIDVGDEAVAVGDEVVLLGRQGATEITANEIAAREQTIGYEIVTRLTSRLDRITV